MGREMWCMQPNAKRILGSTGFEISQLGFGGAFLSADSRCLISKGLSLGG